VSEHELEFSIAAMCRVLRINRSGYYAWRREPHSARAKDDSRVTGLMKQFWLESGCIYGYRKVRDDLIELGEHCGKHRAARLMRREGLRAQIGYGRKRFAPAGPVALAAPNHLDQQFDVAAPNTHWVTDITYLRTAEGWLYLAIVLDLFSRQIVGWSMRNTMHSDGVLDALMMAVWRRKPLPGLILHSDQGTQFTSSDWQAFLKRHGIVCSMSRRGNCYDNAVAESFFQLLKRERVRRRIYPSREAARADVFDYIEMFYNTKRRHGSSGGVSPVEFEKRHANGGS
jgi:putative transposase